MDAAEEVVDPPVAPELEPEDDPVPEAGVEPLDPEPPSFFVSVLVSLLASDFVSAFASLVEAAFGLVEEYRSAYQPPPLRMKLPPLICRFAVLFAHEGQTSTGASVIF